MATSTRLVARSKVFALDCNWPPESADGGEPDFSKNFVVDDESQPWAFSDECALCSFAKSSLPSSSSSSSFTITCTIKRLPVGRCQIFVLSNARVMEVYGSSAKSTVDRFLFSVNGIRNPTTGRHEIVMPQPRPVPQKVNVLKVKLLSLHPDRKGPCEVVKFRIALPEQIFGQDAAPAAAAAAANGGVSPPAQHPHQTQQPASLPTATPSLRTGPGQGSSIDPTASASMAMLMQCESGLSRRVLAKCEQLLEAKMQSLMASVQQAVGTFFAPMFVNVHPGGAQP
eukprot:INCI9870.4.p1 GENE.INCI9870.4~~INCI9870.4.p1  ORF type:complete len:284 (-),score=44.70 INCI9870.4:1261-2112(-)